MRGDYGDTEGETMREHEKKLKAGYEGEGFGVQGDSASCQPVT